MSTKVGLRIEAIRAYGSGEHLWSEDEGFGTAAKVPTSTGPDQPIGEALDRRGIRFTALRAPTSGTFNPEDYLETSTKIQEGALCYTLSLKAPNYAAAMPMDGGANDYLIVPAATGTADNGTYFDLTGSGLQARALFSDGVAKLEQFSPTVNGESGEAIQNWFNFLNDSKLPGYHGPYEYRFAGTLTLAGASVTIDSHPTATLRYMGDFDGLIIKGSLHKLVFGIVTVDISKTPATRSTISYYELGRSNIYIHRLGANSGNGIKYDGPAAGGNSGDNTWHINNGETGNTEYAINLINGASFGLEGERWTANSMYSSVQCTLKIGTPGGPDTIRYNDFDIALFGSRSGSPFSQNLVQFYNSHNTVRMGVWTESLGSEIYCHSGTRNNLVQVTPSLKWTTIGFDKEVRVEDNGINYVEDYRTFGGTLPDDGAVSFRPVREYGVLEVYALRTGYALITFDMANPIINIVTQSGATWETTTGVLDGTTGTDGAITVSIDAATKRIYIENRSGVARITTAQTRMYA